MNDSKRAAQAGRVPRATDLGVRGGPRTPEGVKAPQLAAPED